MDVDGSHFVISNVNILLIEIASNRKAIFDRHGADQLGDDLVADQRFAAPALRDVANETMLDLVPRAGARGRMGDRDGTSGFVGEALLFELPKTDTGAVAAATYAR